MQIPIRHWPLFFRKLLPFVCLALLVSGCAQLWDSAETPQGAADVSEGSSVAPSEPQIATTPYLINAYLARASYEAVDFEQYRVEQQILFYECGTVRAGRQFPREQQARPLSQEQLQLLLAASQRLISSLPTEQLKLSEPGTLAHLADPGQVFVELLLGPKRVKAVSSVDELVNNDGRRARLLLELVRALRRQAGIPRCGDHDFYGIKPH